MINFILGAFIFGYAGYSLVKFMSKSKKGKCGTCSINKSCQVTCKSQKK